MRYNNKNVILPGIHIGPANDEIWYTSTDGNIVAPYDATVLPTIVSNTYVDGKGIIKFASDLTSIGDNAFHSCSGLTSVTIGNSVTSIGEYAFDGCTSLTSVTIPNSVTSIGVEAFYNCESLTSITIPNSVTSIGSNAFKLCSGLVSIIVKNGNNTFDSRNNCNAIIETSTNIIVFGCKNTTIPNNVTSIGGNAFYGCTGLTSITIPDSVTSIGDNAFHSCRGLTSITIPDSVTSIGKYAFFNCTSFTSITIPDSVTSIGDNAFDNCRGLTSVTISNSVTRIGKVAFGSISAKILFSKLYSTYTNKIFRTPLVNSTYTFNVEFNISEIPTDYNISSMLPQHKGKKGTITYNIYTDYEPCKVQALSLANSKTIVNVFHIDGTSWT